ncbi:NAD-dependent epimerase [Marinococcus halophilus]|uniref:UDP-glucose 4-epimerase n=1 Tax=Marinococcus halophilus TaxID=1371 RepID=A0A510Y3E0_MARHA|nr:NAD-dependent epimerase/dehydratase family protein [Marinococcus halophilus]OZT81744.1 NAD-dependent epimerase [Marinococcus halophilus]GEK57703.1 UDP-glucose 4-epimerase [Marinococcus halophilus]
MKRLLITGSNSYIGNSLIEWLKQYSSEYIVETISLRNESWENTNFSQYDTVLHLAGIAHVSSDPKQKELYYKVNRDLTIETAEKAKQDGVKQFIFMSSIIVYGGSVLNNGMIDKSTVPRPRDFYGDSKLQAEQGIVSLESENFKVAIVRPPMIYGKGSKGNYPKLSKLAKATPFFPNIENKRSMLHIDNLCEFIRLLIENEEKGLYFPQNKEYVRTSEIVKLISHVHRKKMILTKIFNPLILLLRKKVNFLNKIFGDLVYEKNMSNYKQEYRIRNLKETITVTELGHTK